MTERYFADANFPLPIVRAMRALGADVDRLVPTAAALDDKEVMAFAFKADRLILTQDKDLRRLALFEKQPCRGVVLLQLRQDGKWMGRADPVAQRIMELASTYRQAVTILSESDLVREPIP